MKTGDDIQAIVTPPPVTTEEALDRFIELESERKYLEARLKEVKEEIAPLHERVLNYFEESGTEKIRRGGMTLYLHSQLWARPIDGDYERGCEALRAAGMEDLIQTRFNIHTLSAVLRERERMGEAFPPEFEGVIETERTFQVRTRG